MKNTARRKTMLLKAELLSSVVAVAGLDEETFLVETEIDLVVTAGGGVLGGSVAETVLRAKLLGDLVVDLGDVLIFLDLEETAAGLLGHARENFLAVDVALAGGIVASIVAAAVTSAWVAAATAGIAASGVATAWIAATTWVAS